MKLGHEVAKKGPLGGGNGQDPNSTIKVMDYFNASG